ncbi:MAG: glycosyltransferase family 4 protein [Candidatus Verstraetearchaeota archaeon]|nr:glycosyltransferase family 4 protein [Candidatus Verstraetearchaeota archaeon]
MTKISIIGPFSTVIGGAEVVKVHAGEVLSKKGFEVFFTGLSLKLFSKFKYLPNIDITQNIKVYALFKSFPQLFGVLQPLLGITAIEKLSSKINTDLVFIDIEGSKNLHKLWKKKKFKLIKYIHFPHSALISLSKINKNEECKEYLEDLQGYFKKYYSSMLMTIYYGGYIGFLRKILPEEPQECDLLLTNSEYIGRFFKILHGVMPIVIHPPVETSDLSNYAEKAFEERDNAVTMLGRISSEKNYEEVIKAISLTNSKPKLKIIGVTTRKGLDYLRYLIKYAKNLGVNIEPYLNVPRSKLGMLLSNSKVFVHATRGEHFGIAIVEAMATGLPVIVHKSGGQFYDIIEKGKYGFYYTSVEELASKIDELICDKNKWTYYSDLSKNRSKNFEAKEFKRKLLYVMEGKVI